MHVFPIRVNYFSPVTYSCLTRQIFLPYLASAQRVLKEGGEKAATVTRDVTQDVTQGRTPPSPEAPQPLGDGDLLPPLPVSARQKFLTKGANILY